uniref:FHA domain-containing protein n=1 Tax=Strigops habroptila TaxID=2489341 RepID=A0A672V3E1_STRHB
MEASSRTPASPTCRVQTIIQNSPLDLIDTGKGLKVQTEKPHLVSLGSGRLSTAITLLPLEEGRTTIGTATTDIILQGPGLAPQHCYIENAAGMLTLHPCGNACAIDGVPLRRPMRLTQGCTICLGQATFLRFNHPAEAKWMKSMIPAGGRSPPALYGLPASRCLGGAVGTPQPARRAMLSGPVPCVWEQGSCLATDVLAIGLARQLCWCLLMINIASEEGDGEGSKAQLSPLASLAVAELSPVSPCWGWVCGAPWLPWSGCLHAGVATRRLRRSFPRLQSSCWLLILLCLPVCGIGRICAGAAPGSRGCSHPQQQSLGW